MIQEILVFFILVFSVGYLIRKYFLMGQGKKSSGCEKCAADSTIVDKK